MLVLAAPDKMRGTLSGPEAAAAIAAAARDHGAECEQVPVADGGEGTLDALGGANRTTLVSGPLGDPVRADWRLAGGLAVVEMARASGLDVIGGPEQNDPISATTYGTGELIAAAVDAGATRIIVGVGGSATTDGGLGALRALEPLPRVRRARLSVACDVDLTFVHAARVFAGQKGATAAQVELLERRLERLAQVYERDHGLDVRELPGSGAAGGLAGGLAAIGAELVAGFDLVADELALAERVAGADLVVTTEGHLDDQTFRGKAVGGVVALAQEAGVPVLVVVGDADPDVAAPVPVHTLVGACGAERARTEAAACLREVVSRHLADTRP